MTSGKVADLSWQLGIPFFVKPQKIIARKFLANWHFSGLGLRLMIHISKTLKVALR
jgi:hypothetical protein